ncbi:putative 3-beta hydroxysteroid dehydrogenase/isomerase family protein [Aspergillus campestris IBT 28561]|uniref:3-beta hydroxysteroid dehydrogenase/isomerase family protein n=1 Tax=Aspergillus campestris (strain IBT 28561) TaxID=1392248 RepID=A0A2I1D2R2_ASPC2|nr:putative 3-beta hydroxysteroid dehydrogenase/isomerase family protein [Aspergillus campestris IBT 28561]PKY04165.1 putative 3-beta hydroxysteroid dehydrogenase/isomerase family protein [Aspergillus campestris IBT 28561]
MSNTTIASCVAGAAFLYLYHVNRAMVQVPEEVRRLSPHRWTVEEIKAAYEKAADSPADMAGSIPPKQNRRYIVTGGSGLVGNWIVTHLLTRGEDPAAIRILDLQAPSDRILNQGVAYIKTNIVDEESVQNAFSAPWPQAVAQQPLSVFHCAAAIRPAERHRCFLPLCRNVNVHGSVNVLNAAKKYGASCMVATSSGSIGVHRASFWIPPWSSAPRNLAQVVSDSTPLPQSHDEFFGNYAVAKAEAEAIIRDADSLDGNFRTGCIRPTNGIYGIGGDTSATVTGQYLRSGGSPSWTYDVVHSFVNAENVSIAHLLYEQRLIEHTANPTALPNIGGQAFVITDPNPPVNFADVYRLLSTLSKSPCYAILQHKYLPWLLPRITGDMAQLQPGLFCISSVHTVGDDSRARKSPAQGGLGYSTPLTTLDGMAKQLEEWNRNLEPKDAAVIEEKDYVNVSSEGVEVNFPVPSKKL